MVEELLLDWLYSFLTAEEQDRLTGWHLGVASNQNHSLDAVRYGVQWWRAKWKVGKGPRGT